MKPKVLQFYNHFEKTFPMLNSFFFTQKIYMYDLENIRGILAKKAISISMDKE